MPNINPIENLRHALDNGDYPRANHLIQYLTNINEKDNQGLTLLDLTLSNREYRNTKFLIEAGAKVIANPDANTHPYGTSLLEDALRNKEYEIAEFLIKAGANVNAKDVYGTKSLLEIVSYGAYQDYNLANLLITYKAEVNVETNNGNLLLEILMLSRKHRDYFMASLFINHGAKVNSEAQSKFLDILETPSTANNCFADLMRIVLLGEDQDNQEVTQLNLPNTNKGIFAKITNFLMAPVNALSNTINYYYHSVTSYFSAEVNVANIQEVANSPTLEASRRLFSSWPPEELEASFDTPNKSVDIRLNSRQVLGPNTANIFNSSVTQRHNNR